VEIAPWKHSLLGDHSKDRIVPWKLFHGTYSVEVAPWKYSLHGNIPLETIPRTGSFYGNYSMEPTPRMLLHRNIPSLETIPRKHSLGDHSKDRIVLWKLYGTYSADVAP
jgi:hypothetical protein